MGDARRRAVIRRATPQVDGGRFPAKRVAGEAVEVGADVYADGHDVLAVVVRHRHAEAARWAELRMRPVGNDRWRAEFTVEQLGRHLFTIEAWVDQFATWRRDLAAKAAAHQDVAVELLAGSELVAQTAERGSGKDARRLSAAATLLGDRRKALEERVDLACKADLADLVFTHAERRFATRLPGELEIEVESPRARASSWYELFPRSTVAGRHGTLKDVEGLLPYVAGMGFDVLYLPPVHPIGSTARKGPNNVEGASPDDVGSPWAIGSAEGGHTSVHPELGTVDDVRRLAAAAREHDIELALDIAFQCSPDHPWVTEHPEWFRKRADGSIQYAENPPKRYQDIYPLDFESEDWESLWTALADVVRFWIDVGVRVFRVDNPHTKPLRFWEWLIAQVRADHPDVIFLSEAFTRPALMQDLAKRGFSQSYTYFTWRNRRWELEQYFTELTRTEQIDFLRPNAWPNTPDILPEYLQYGGRPAHVIRLVLAATLCANYGIYGPAFELMDSRAREPGTEEYLDSEKYQLREWDLDRQDSLRDVIGRVNRIRRANTALQQDRSLTFHGCDNQEIIVYSKMSEDRSNVMLTVVNLDPHWTQGGWVDLDLDALGVDASQGFQVHDLLGDSRFLWHGAHNFVQLDPHVLPAHIFVVRRRERSEQDFDYFL